MNVVMLPMPRDDARHPDADQRSMSLAMFVIPKTDDADQGSRSLAMFVTPKADDDQPGAGS